MLRCRDQDKIRFLDSCWMAGLDMHPVGYQDAVPLYLARGIDVIRNHQIRRPVLHIEIGEYPLLGLLRACSAGRGPGRAGRREGDERSVDYGLLRPGMRTSHRYAAGCLLAGFFIEVNSPFLRYVEFLFNNKV